MLSPMAIPRALLVDPEVALFYHLNSKCVRGAWLFGKRGKKNYKHRKEWVEKRILQISQWYAVEVYTYVVMDNHLHILIFFDPKACEYWSAHEVAFRWFKMFPPRNGKFDKAVAKLMDNPELLEKRRYQLGSMSEFMKHLKGPIAARANKEDGVKGHFFAERFYSGAIIDEESTLAAMSYIDVNPVRAKIAKTLEATKHGAVQERLAHAKNTSERVEEWLEPVVSGLEPKVDEAEPRNSDEPRPGVPRIKLGQYLEMLRTIIRDERTKHKSPEQKFRAKRWAEQAALLRKRQRAYGTAEQLDDWTHKRGFRCVEQPMS